MQTSDSRGSAAREFRDPGARDPRAAEVLKDVATSLGGVIRSELRLAAAELKQATLGLKQHSTLLLVGAVAVVLGVFPILAFLCIALGRLLNDNYWLSSLIVGLIFCAGGGFLAYSALKKIRLANLTLPRTRHSLEQEQAMIRGKVRHMSNYTQGRIHEVKDHSVQEVQDLTQRSTS